MPSITSRRIVPNRTDMINHRQARRPADCKKKHNPRIQQPHLFSSHLALAFSASWRFDFVLIRTSDPATDIESLPPNDAPEDSPPVPDQQLFAPPSELCHTPARSAQAHSSPASSKSGTPRSVRKPTSAPSNSCAH